MTGQWKRTSVQKQGKQRDEEKDNELINVDWAGLPKVILETIFERLPLIDCISVSDVCESWKSVFAPELLCWQKLGFPSLLMSGQNERKLRTCISMVEKRAWEMELPEAHGKYCWGSFHDWLIIVDSFEYFYINISLFNPFTRTKFDLPRTWNFYHKMVLSGLPIRQNLVCMLVHGEFRRLAFWGQGSSSWLEHKLDGEPFEDAVFCNGSFYLMSNDCNKIWQVDAASVFAIVCREGVSTLDATEIKLQLHEVNMRENHTNEGVLKYLVESRGKVLLICRSFCTLESAVLETQSFEVYMLDVDHMCWKMINNLEDQMLFVGKCCSRSFSSTEMGFGMKNCIYFSNDHSKPWLNEWDSVIMRGIASQYGMDNTGRKNWGIFNLSDEDISKFSFRGNRDIWGPIWFTAPLWWYCKNFA